MNRQTLLSGAMCLCLAGALASCDKEPVKGCTDPLSYSYSADAEEDDGSCKYYYGGKNFAQLDVASEIDMDDEFSVTIDGKSVGRLTHYFPNGVSCGNPDAVGTIVQAGSHKIRAVGNGGTNVIEGTVTITAQDCKVVLLEDL